MKQEAMTTRIRLYLWGATVRHLAMGVLIIAVPASFNVAVYDELYRIAPRWIWVGALLAVGTYLGWCAATSTERGARIGLIASSTMSLMWATAFAFIVVKDGVPSATALLLFADLCYKDIVICTGSLRSPLAPIIQAYSDEVK